MTAEENESTLSLGTTVPLPLYITITLPDEENVIDSPFLAQKEPVESEVPKTMLPVESNAVEATLTVESEATQAMLPVESDAVEATIPVESEATESILPVESDAVEATMPVKSEATQAMLPVESDAVEATIPVESEATQPMFPVESEPTGPMLTEIALCVEPVISESLVVDATNTMNIISPDNVRSKNWKYLFRMFYFVCI